MYGRNSEATQGRITQRQQGIYMISNENWTGNGKVYDLSLVDKRSLRSNMIGHRTTRKVSSPVDFVSKRR